MVQGGRCLKHALGVLVGNVMPCLLFWRNEKHFELWFTTALAAIPMDYGSLSLDRGYCLKSFEAVEPKNTPHFGWMALIWPEGRPWTADVVAAPPLTQCRPWQHRKWMITRGSTHSSSTQRGAVPGDNYGPIQTIIAADMGATVDNGRKGAQCNAIL